MWTRPAFKSRYLHTDKNFFGRFRLDFALISARFWLYHDRRGLLFHPESFSSRRGCCFSIKSRRIEPLFRHSSYGELHASGAAQNGLSFSVRPLHMSRSSHQWAGSLHPSPALVFTGKFLVSVGIHDHPLYIVITHAYVPFATIWFIVMLCVLRRWARHWRSELNDCGDSKTAGGDDERTTT